MKILVQKFGGTSVQNEESRLHALKHIKDALAKKYKVIVVVSAIGRLGEPYATDTLLSLIGGDNTKLNNRERDLLMAVGETISASVFTEMLKEDGLKATALNGQAAGILTNDDFSNAKVEKVLTKNIMSIFEHEDVAVVTGFQGFTEAGDTTTLGRGGSDTTAAILGAVFNAERVDIFTDVSGMMTADPRLVATAQFLDTVSYQEVANMANEGAKVVHPRAVEIAMQGNIPLRIRSTYQNVDELGTLVTSEKDEAYHYRLVTGIAHVTNLVQFTVPTTAENSAEKIFNDLADQNLSVDFINIFPQKVVFNLDKVDAKMAEKMFAKNQINYEKIDDCAKLSVVGAGIRGVPGVTAKIVTALSNVNVEILQVTDSYTTMWVLVNGETLQKALSALHAVFLENK